MEKRINIAELLKDCPKGMELDCTMFDNVTLEGLDPVGYPIKIKLKGDDKCMYLTKNGCWNKSDNAKCVIFPKGKTNWEGFVPPCKFKDGDVLFVDSSDDEEDESYQYIFILNKPDYYGKWHAYCFLDGFGSFDSKETYLTECIYHPRFATEEEKQKLFDAIKANGYRWNEETKTLEKVIIPKFKVGDRVKSIFNNTQYKITELTDTYYTLEEVTNKFLYIQPIYEVVNWELVPDKFDINTLVPFESRVLVRNSKTGIWKPAIWGCYTGETDGCCVLGGICWLYCIPYEGNEHLRGKIDDCDDFYKNWEE